MRYTADLHLHSKFSRATAKNLDFENLYRTAMIKGVTVIGTGDFTHPAWIEEIKSKLEPAEPGLFRLKKEHSDAIDKTVLENCKGQVRFILQCEISNIYKKNDRVRKNHNLVYFPDIKSVEKFNAALDAIGNIKSDGRPILGLDAYELLKIMLDINEEGMFIPAHIWTPWFSMFGSKSGYDSMAECFGDLTDRIFAVETGLSSDPPMNWRVKDLDNVRLVSSSDAHSPGVLGRNASVFNTDLSYDGIRNALEGKSFDAYKGTLDMYPDQGKYHYDGHRKCNICMNPATTQKIDAICPECGRPLTCGVLYRVQELASRPEGFRPKNRHGYRHIIPLTDILSEIFSVGPKTKKVATFYNKAIETLGPELNILLDLEIEAIEKAGVPLLGAAIRKMREGDIHVDPGFDGEYGVVRIFTEQERQALKGEKNLLFNLPAAKKKKKSRARIYQTTDPRPEPMQKKKKNPALPKDDLLGTLNPEQKKAVESDAVAVVVQAGPGTGKTRTLTARIAWLISKKKVSPHNILALTFTNKSARELAQRIKAYIPAQNDVRAQVTAATFHAFCLQALKTYQPGFNLGLIDEDTRMTMIRDAFEDKVKQNEVKKAAAFISACKQQLLEIRDDLSVIDGFDNLSDLIDVYKNYTRLCERHHVLDFEDLIFKVVRLIKENKEASQAIKADFSYLFIDEYQDLNYGQYVLARLLASDSQIFVIGDPDQSIYGFRGSDNKYFSMFEKDFPGCEKIFLKQNYRSTRTILDASFQVMCRAGNDDESRNRVYSDIDGAKQLIIKETATEQAEAVSICKMIEKLVGGTSFFSMDSGRTAGNGHKEYTFGDFAVLYRTTRQARVFADVLEKEGIPFQSTDSHKIFQTPGIRQVISICRLIAGKAVPLDLIMLFEYYRTGGLEGARSVINAEWDRGRADLPSFTVFFESMVDKMPGTVRLTARRNMIAAVERIVDLGKGFQDDFKNNGLPGAIEKMVKASGLSDLIFGAADAEKAYEKVINQAHLAEGPDDFIEKLALGQDADILIPGVEKVALMTLHAAKGLEFPVVFVTGCELGLIPFARDGRTVEDPEEERRLFYVGMTRAMDILCLTYARKRRIYGAQVKRQRSLFIEDIEKKLLRMEIAAFKTMAKKREQQLELF